MMAAEDIHTAGGRRRPATHKNAAQAGAAAPLTAGPPGKLSQTSVAAVLG